MFRITTALAAMLALGGQALNFEIKPSDSEKRRDFTTKAPRHQENQNCDLLAFLGALVPWW
jgi:hypothetical protein